MKKVIIEIDRDDLRIISSGLRGAAEKYRRAAAEHRHKFSTPGGFDLAEAWERNAITCDEVAYQFEWPTESP